MTKIAYHSTLPGGQEPVQVDMLVRNVDLGIQSDLVVAAADKLPAGLHERLRQLVEALFAQELITLFSAEQAPDATKVIFHTAEGSDRAYLDFATNFCQTASLIAGRPQSEEPRIDNLKEISRRIMAALGKIL